MGLTNSEQLMLALNYIVGHPAGVQRLGELVVGVRSVLWEEIDLSSLLPLHSATWKAQMQNQGQCWVSCGTFLGSESGLVD